MSAIGNRLGRCGFFVPQEPNMSRNPVASAMRGSGLPGQPERSSRVANDMCDARRLVPATYECISVVCFRHGRVHDRAESNYSDEVCLLNQWVFRSRLARGAFPVCGILADHAVKRTTPIVSALGVRRFPRCAARTCGVTPRSESFQRAAIEHRPSRSRPAHSPKLSRSAFQTRLG